ncbi:MAG: nuclear transport factor 2 family protein [Actinobacteria bacterium]|nr:nuclear transport factor 2 family protein [Actinomycetota bacterium]
MTDVTVEDLLDIERIKRLKYAYLRCLDQKDWSGLGALFTPDARAEYSGGNYSYTGREEIIGFLVENMGREAFHSSHRVHHPEIDVDGDSAVGVWALEDTVVDTDWGFVLFGAAFYRDEYRRSDAGWRISHTSYRRSFEAIVPTADVEGFRVTASWWRTDGRSTLPVQEPRRPDGAT